MTARIALPDQQPEPIPPDDSPYVGYAAVQLGPDAKVGEEVLILFSTPAAAEAAARQNGLVSFAVRPVHFVASPARIDLPHSTQAMER